MSGFEFDHDLESPHANQPRDELEHTRIRNDHAPDELVLIPTEATEDELMTEWAVATGSESFVDLEHWR